MPPDVFRPRTKHKSLRRFCGDTVNTKTLERSVIGNAVCQQVYTLEQVDTLRQDVSLVGGHIAPKLVADLVRSDLQPHGNLEVMTSTFARISVWSTCAESDVVLVKDRHNFIAGWIWKHCHVAGMVVSLIQLADPLEWDAASATATWRLRERPEWCATEDILAPVIFTWLGSNTVRTIIDVHYR